MKGEGPFCSAPAIKMPGLALRGCNVPLGCPCTAAVTVKVNPATDYCTQRHCLAGLCSLIAADPVTMR